MDRQITMIKTDLSTGAARSKWTITALFALALGLAGCGGGGGDTSSGGGGGGGSGAGVAGTYSGLGTGTVSAGGLSAPFSGSITFQIDAAGNVTLDPGEFYSVSAPLSGDSFDMSASAAAVDGRCSGTLSIHGTVSGGMINGSMSSGGLSCLGVSGEISGTFSAAKVAKALRRSRTSLMNSIGGALDSMR